MDFCFLSLQLRLRLLTYFLVGMVVIANSLSEAEPIPAAQPGPRIHPRLRVRKPGPTVPKSKHLHHRRTPTRHIFPVVHTPRPSKATTVDRLINTKQATYNLRQFITPSNTSFNKRYIVINEPIGRKRNYNASSTRTFNEPNKINDFRQVNTRLNSTCLLKKTIARICNYNASSISDMSDELEKMDHLRQIYNEIEPRPLKDTIGHICNYNSKKYMGPLLQFNSEYATGFGPKNETNVETIDRKHNYNASSITLSDDLKQIDHLRQTYFRLLGPRKNSLKEAVEHICEYK